MATGQLGPIVDRILTGILAIAAVTMAAAFLHTQYAAQSRKGETSSEPTRRYDGWRKWLDRGTLDGDSAAPVTIVEFADFECVGCKAFHERTLKTIRDEFGESVAFVYVHFPLRSHRFSTHAAVAAECAGAQGRYGVFVDLVFARQDSIGLKSWQSFAEEAGVEDMPLFDQCMESAWSKARVRSGRALGDTLGVRATPTVFVNGWLYPTPPDAANLAVDIQQFLTGEVRWRSEDPAAER